MAWSWQHEDWPQFNWDAAALTKLEEAFLKQSGLVEGILLHLTDADQDNLKVEIISTEALKTSEIEGEVLNRDSVQSSIRRHFGLLADNRRIPPAERGVAEVMVDVYRHYAQALSGETLYQWHKQLMNGRTDVEVVGAYRKGDEPMQVVSGAVYNPNIHYEAPPSKVMAREMKQFLRWFNATGPKGKESLSALARAGLAHLYFVLIHPFEDGNGRIGRAIATMALSQAVGTPILLALSHIINKRKKAYYQALERANKGMEVTEWLIYFAKVVLEAQEYSLAQINFILAKTKLYDRLRGQLNQRQEKVLERMFREGVEGFKGGLSAKNYQTITGASPATTTRDLTHLVELGVLRREGELRGTRYHLAYLSGDF